MFCDQFSMCRERVYLLRNITSRLAEKCPLWRRTMFGHAAQLRPIPYDRQLDDDWCPNVSAFRSELEMRQAGKGIMKIKRDI